MTELCEARFHHPMKPSVAVVYAYKKDGNIEPLPLTETTSLWEAVLGAMAGAAP